MSDLFSPSPASPALVIGASGMDVVGRLVEELQLETSNQGQIRTSFGGVGRNIAENLARLGQPVTLITAVGKDEAGDRLLEYTEAAGVDVQRTLRMSDLPTAAYLGVITPKGELELAVDDMRVMAGLTPAYLRKQAAAFQQASMLFVDANLPKETLRTAIHLARRARIPICADPTAATLAHRFQPYLSDLHLVTPNSAEASVLTGSDVDATRRRQTMAAARKLVAHGVKVAIVTLGQFGVCYATSDTSGQIPAIRTEIVDPTGAGDALTAAVIFALLNDIPLDDAVRLGVSAATLTLRHPGAVLHDLSLEKLYDQLVI
jgi:pseudouridine kinase